MAGRRISQIIVTVVNPDGSNSGETILRPIPASSRALDHTHWTKEDALLRFERFLTRGDRQGLEAAYLALARHGALLDALKKVVKRRKVNLPGAEALLHLWNSRGLHGVQRCLSVNLPVYAEAVKRIAPPYAGPSLTLYRGQSLSRYENGDVGIGWTGKLEVANFFAGYRSTPGIVLEVQANSGDIAAHLPNLIQTPKTDRNGGSEFEDEYLLDPRGLMKRIRAR